MNSNIIAPDGLTIAGYELIAEREGAVLVTLKDVDAIQEGDLLNFTTSERERGLSHSTAWVKVVSGSPLIGQKKGTTYMNPAMRRFVENAEVAHV